MIDEVDAALRSLLREEALVGADVEVVFDAPTREWAARREAPTVNAYLYEISEDLDKRTQGLINRYDAQGRVTERTKPPRYLSLSYLLTAWTHRPEDEHRLLSELLACLLDYEAMPPHRLTGSVGALGLPVAMRVCQPPPRDRSLADVWTAMGGELKPSVDVVLVVPVVPRRGLAAAPPVLEPTRVDLDNRNEHGQAPAGRTPSNMPNSLVSREETGNPGLDRTSQPEPRENHPAPAPRTVIRSKRRAGNP